jgi:hypothetical protein
MNKKELSELTATGEQMRNVELKCSLNWKDATTKATRAL